MRKVVVYLDLRKAKKENMLVNREEFLQKYDCGRPFKMAMMKGTPLLQNIEGIYIHFTDLPSLMSFKDRIMADRISAGIEKGKYVEYRWRR